MTVNPDTSIHPTDGQYTDEIVQPHRPRPLVAHAFGEEPLTHGEAPFAEEEPGLIGEEANPTVGSETRPHELPDEGSGDRTSRFILGESNGEPTHHDIDSTRLGVEANHIEYAYTNGMAPEAIDGRLREASTGVLALADDGESYAIPVAHHYTGDALYLRLSLTGDDRKRRFIETTDTACYLLYDVEQTDAPREIESWSVLASGEIHELPADADISPDPSVINNAFPPVPVFDAPIGDIQIELFEFDINSITGRLSPRRQAGR